MNIFDLPFKQELINRCFQLYNIRTLDMISLEKKPYYVIPSVLTLTISRNPKNTKTTL